LRDDDLRDSSQATETLCADSESRILANKKFLALWTSEAIPVSQTRIFCQLSALIRGRVFCDSASPRPLMRAVHHCDDGPNFHRANVLATAW
jgi:hypothetical protein